MKHLFNDGYIEIKESGNTYCGELAHKIMHIAENISREKNYDFDYCLKCCIEASNNILNEMVNNKVNEYHAGVK